MRELTSDLRAWLLRAQEIGFIGPKPVELVYEHSLGFADVVDQLLRTGLLPSSFRAIDLGSGAGVPGIFLALWFPDSQFTLVDSMKKRYRFLEEITSSLGLSTRVTIFGGRSEEAALSVGMREEFDLVTARGFANPSATAENASGFLKRNGILLVSEPPIRSPDRWSESALQSLGFGVMNLEQLEFSYRWMRKNLSPRGIFPREVGIPEKFPLF